MKNKIKSKPSWRVLFRLWVILYRDLGPPAVAVVRYIPANSSIREEPGPEVTVGLLKFRGFLSFKNCKSRKKYSA
jgi:hypothetical protein